MYSFVRLCVLGDVFRIIEILPPAWGSRAVHGMFVSLDKRWRSHRIPRETRKKMIRSYRGLTPQIPESCYVDQSAQLIGDIELGEHASVWMNAVLRGDVHSIRVGHYSNIQDCSVLHGMKEKFGVFLGDYVTVGHSVTLHGCTIEDRCLIGMGSIVLNGARIGSGSIIAAGTLIPEGTVIEPNSLWMGSPGKFRRRLEEKDQEMILMYAENYLGYKEMYLKEK